MATDIEHILSHRYDLGDDYWTTPDHRLQKGAPFSTLESILYLLELGFDPSDPLMKATADLIFSTQKKDGRFKTMPNSGIYPCHTAMALNTLCYMGYSQDERLQRSFRYFLDTQQEDGGWKCNKYSFGRGEETQYSTPNTTLYVLDSFRFTRGFQQNTQLEKAAEFLLWHWEVRKPISPCHYGIGTLFMQVEYPFRGYNLFYYLYVLSFYPCARNDPRFLEALKKLEEKTINNQIIVERVVPKLNTLAFCRKGKPSLLATKRYQEILTNLKK